MHQDATRPPPARRRRKRGRAWALFIFLLIFIALLGAGILWFIRNYGPVDTRITPEYGSDKPVFYAGSLLDGEAIGEGDSLKLPLPLLQQIVDGTIAYEPETNSIILTTGTRVLRLVTDQLTAWANEVPFELRFPVEVVDDVPYVPLAPIADLYGLEVIEAPGTGFAILRMPGDVIVYVEVPEAEGEEPPPSTWLRSEPSVRAPIIEELAPGSRAAVIGEASGWYRLQTESGHLGYADKRSLVWSGTETVSSPAVTKKPFVADRKMGERVVLTWEQVYTKNPDPSGYGAMPGLNVVSPTWFHVLDEEGALENRADKAYVTWAHKRGYRVWALFSNSFDPDLTSQVLSTYDRRMAMARQLIAWAQLYELDGINVDFENVYLKDGPKFTQFMRELTPLLHEAGLTVSVDVTFAGGSETWSLFLDRKALGEVVDYMMVMAYDEHWASSPVAGSVASLPWVETGMRRIVEQIGVPAEKVLLGVPLYTRIWTEKTVDGKPKVSSKAVGMDTVNKLLKDRKLTPIFDEAAGQHYVQYEEDGGLHKIWIEDDVSMRARAELANELGLAGIAAWSRNFANSTVWETIDNTLNGK